MKLNKKGFIFVEAIIIMTVIMISMLGLYTTSSKVLTRIKQNRNYDRISDVYKAYALYSLINKTNASLISSCSSGVCNISSSVSSNASSLLSSLNGTNKQVYIVNTESFNLSSLSVNKTLKNYIENLDLYHNYKYLIIEYVGSDDAYFYSSLVVR